MVTLVALIIWRLPIYVIVPAFLVFGSLDGLYLSSALTKVPDGAWFTLCLAVVLSSIFILWRYGKENQWHAEAEDRVPPSHLLAGSLDGDAGNGESNPHIRLAQSLGGTPVTRLRGIGIFFDKSGSAKGTPTVFVHFLQKFQAAPAVVVFFHIRSLSTPTIAPEDRFTVSRCFPRTSKAVSLQNFFRVTVRHGYTDQVLSNDIGLIIYEHIRDFIIHESGATFKKSSLGKGPNESVPTSDESSGTPPATVAQRHEHEGAVREDLAALQTAFEDQVVHIVGKEQMRIREVRNAQGWVRRIALAAFLWLRSNTGSRVANMNLDVEKLVEVGFVKVI